MNLVRLLPFLSLVCLPIGARAVADTYPVGNVIFIHPDGAGSSVWNALRMLEVGPDGTIHWDRMEKASIYKAHVADSLAASSHGGATVHAYGIRVRKDSFGTDGGEELTALSGFPGSILAEAKAAGLRVGAVNSGHLCEPGTAVFLTSAPSRQDTDAIARGCLLSGADVSFSGGERYLLPEGVEGRFGTGVRSDGADLRELAAANGIRMVYEAAELGSLGTDDLPVFGIFADKHTFHDKPEEVLERAGLPLYEPAAPDVATMMATALDLLEPAEGPFFLVVEEEGTDNFANSNNAVGTLEAARRADAAIGVALRFQEEHPDTLIIVAADSEAGGFSIYAPTLGSGEPGQPGEALRLRNMQNGAPVDGIDGSHSEPFLSAPDAKGIRLPFAISWAGFVDFHGGIIARIHGLNAGTVGPVIDNVEIYRLMYRTLFGRNPEAISGE